LPAENGLVDCPIQDFDRQIRGRSPRYGRLNLIRYIGLFKNQKGRLKTGFQTTFSDFIDSSHRWRTV